jgi:hypothetical protein
LRVNIRELLFLLGAGLMMGWFITLQIQVIRQRRLGMNLRGRIAQILRTNFFNQRKS